MSDPKDKKTHQEEEQEMDFHGGTVIDEQGNEVEITETMVRKAIHELDPEAYPEVEESEYEGSSSAEGS